MGWPWLGLRLLALCLPWSFAYHDDDCQLGHTDAEVVPWRRLLGQLSTGGRRAGQQLAEKAVRRRSEARGECPLGYAAACLAMAQPYEVVECIDGLPLVRILASRWPLLELLGEIQRDVSGDAGTCSGMHHPSIIWDEFREAVNGFQATVPPWIKGLAENDMVPEELETALAHAEGITWKSSSAAVANGRSIAEYTAQCEHGVLVSYAIRGFGIALSDGDVYRNLQRNIESLQLVISKVGLFLHSAWPVFDVLHTLSLIKKRLHDTQLAPEDFVSTQAIIPDTGKSAVWQEAATLLRRAGSDTGRVFLTSVPLHRVNFLFPFLKRANRLGFVRHVLVAPLRKNVTDSCRAISEMFVSAKEPDVPEEWSPCLPFISQFPDKVQYLYIFVALQLGLTVLWFDFHMAWIQPPMPWLETVLDGPVQPLQYHQPCRTWCPPAGMPDIFVADEFYVPNWPRSSLLLLLPTEAARDWVWLMLRWLCDYPYAIAHRGMQFLLDPNNLDIVPSVSMLPAGKDVPSVAIGNLDVEQQFVTTDGWFGKAEGIVGFEVGQHLMEEERVRMLDALFEGSDSDVTLSLNFARKVLSPLRPTQRLYSVFQGDASPFEACQWQTVPGAFISGYAADVEDVYPSPSGAQCRCLGLGAACLGITCEGGADDASDGTDCTLRAGTGPHLLTRSPVDEVSFVKECTHDGCDAPAVERLVHVNFADGCCEAEQNQSSETAKLYGAHESRAHRGDFLDEDFKVRNHALLTFNRTPELTQHKTPTGKIGYYVWKPYVVLKTLEDESLPFDTTVVIWTDAGIHFVGDIWPLVNKYMPISDVAATRTPMLESDFSKRDAFLLLDADYFGIRETQQIATGVIIARKTPLAIEFMRRWLRACEEPRIMTEEPSVLGYPDHLTFKNNNDDQTAFSLLFKQHGFSAFSVGERDAMVYTGRNLAKFIKASDDFALGVSSDREAYLQAADQAAAKGPAS